MRVRLTENLVQYDARLTGGQEGETDGHSRMSDRFAFVVFDCGARLDVLWRGLDIIDEKVLAKIAERERKRDYGAARAKNAVLRVGPRGGFRSLSFEYVDEEGVPTSYSTGFREDADRLIEVMEANGIAVTERREP